MEEATKEILQEYIRNTINIQNKNIKGLLDLKHCEYYKKIDCSNNEITKIINLPESLEYLDCSHNKIKEAGLPINLEYLDFSY